MYAQIFSQHHSSHGNWISDVLALLDLHFKTSVKKQVNTISL